MVIKGRACESPASEVELHTPDLVIENPIAWGIFEFAYHKAAKLTVELLPEMLRELEPVKGAQRIAWQRPRVNVNITVLGHCAYSWIHDRHGNHATEALEVSNRRAREGLNQNIKTRDCKQRVCMSVPAQACEAQPSWHSRLSARCHLEHTFGFIRVNPG